NSFGLGSKMSEESKAQGNEIRVLPVYLLVVLGRAIIDRQQVMERGAFVELGEARSTLRWRRHQDGLVHFEVNRPNPSYGHMEVATFTCSIEQFMSVCEGGSFQIAGRHGNLMARCNDNQIWIIFSVADWNYQDSCLVSMDRFQMLLQGEELRSRGRHLMM
ncbi:MAG TPA: hypothetical protein VK934_12745, partial [Fimbriimonas sp.]|nr:hypothetical protein [Fimbriimonas sp.]